LQSLPIRLFGGQAAVIGLTKSLGRELAESGILVNCVTPALIDTPLAGTLSDETRTAAFDKIPMRRMGRPDEVAPWSPGWLPIRFRSPPVQPTICRADALPTRRVSAAHRSRLAARNATAQRE
jgi:NAD(P)-dependent dehydrogenase (short-subunit alcohol dehydrogenase family)